ncbi:lytic transglycosylase domain-containing protein [Paracidovorax anthurii]|uniref:Transglycosylase-like protein with SLT domain n=1 Tax=Paracidovorax anthurii TaxID=78229 RepID=A0A328ZTP6_9BURK|nr:lytic transglycosylase domain-containing protein [Paracidovorax anthurii]RAR86247.1 transglycosylase-like protein with SLT domain [Paracidovorax anthurii]WCM95062.1 lytic transglycosylase domain-containing protein [Acidovorax sp. NCPPB 2350]
MTASGKVIGGVRTFASDVIDGFLEITHSSFALVGLTVAFGAITLTARPDLRQAGEEQLMGWLQARQVALMGVPTEPEASERATATNPKDLPKEQAAVAFWLSKKYRVAPEPLAALVAEAYEIGSRTKLDPTLILAIMAVESSFNPFAQSAVGAQGLMQVMTRVHTDKYENFGGHFAAFDPVSNLRVGVRVLQECIARAGSVEGGLRFYVGAANLPDDGGYATKVMAEHMRLRQVASGRSVPIFTPPVPGAPIAPPMLSTQAPAQTVPAKASGTTAEAVPTATAEDKVALLSPDL